MMLIAHTVVTMVEEIQDSDLFFFVCFLVRPFSKFAISWVFNRIFVADSLCFKQVLLITVLETEKKR